MKLLLTAIAGAAGLSSLASAQDAPFDAAEEAAIEDVVRDYILENPDIILLALQELEFKPQREAIAANWDAIVNDPRDFAVGPVDAPVTIVEFFDYNCGFCKRSATWMQDVLETHEGQVRMVFKEAPIFADRAEGSGLGAKAALSAINQDKYLELHFALMAERGQLDRSGVIRVARDQGLDMRWLLNEMAEERHQAHIDDTLALLGSIAQGRMSTPFLIINGQPVAGADFDRLNTLLEESLAEGEGPWSPSDT